MTEINVGNVVGVTYKFNASRRQIEEILEQSLGISSLGVKKLIPELT